MNRIVDASVVVKALLPEEGSDRAALLMKQPVMAPDSLIPECLNALRKAVARGRMSPEDALEAARALGRADIALESARPLAEDALSLAMKLSLSSYDCVYLALSRKLGGVVITADSRVLARCRQADALALGLRVESLYESPMVQERPVRPYLPRRATAARPRTAAAR